MSTNPAAVKVNKTDLSGTSTGYKVFAAVIPRSVRLSEAPSFGEPIYYYDRKSKGSDAYLALAKELIKLNKKMGKS